VCSYYPTESVLIALGITAAVCVSISLFAIVFAVGVCSYYQTESVLIALGITAAVCVSISLFAIQTKVSTECCQF